MERVDTGRGSLAPIPWEESSEVVIARVQALQSYLSQDGSALFTEYALALESTLKGPAGARDRTLAERDGGALELPDGRKIRHLVLHQGFPKVDGRYLLFLGTEPGRPLPRILRALAIVQGRLYPIDGTRDAPTVWQGLEISGASLEAFLAHLRRLGRIPDDR